MKRLIASIVFVGILFTGTTYLNAATSTNNGNESIWHFYQKLEPDSLDVLFVGSSKIYTIFNPVYLWEKYRFSSYVISGPMMDAHTEYYALREALKTQKPKIIVLGFYILDDKESQLREVQKENITVMPFGAPKIGAAMNKRIKPSERERLLFPLEQYHSRFLLAKELKKNSFMLNKYKRESKIIFAGHRVKKEPVPQVYANTAGDFNEELFEKNYAELDKCLGLLATTDAKVILASTPTADVGRFRRVERILKERVSKKYPDFEFDFASSHLDDVHLDYSRDFADDRHLTPSGAEKYSSMFGALLMRHLSKEKPFKSKAYGKTVTYLDNNVRRYERLYGKETGLERPMKK